MTRPVRVLAIISKTPTRIWRDLNKCSYLQDSEHLQNRWSWRFHMLQVGCTALLQRKPRWIAYMLHRHRIFEPEGTSYHIKWAFRYRTTTYFLVAITRTYSKVTSSLIPSQKSLIPQLAGLPRRPPSSQRLSSSLNAIDSPTERSLSMLCSTPIQSQRLGKRMLFDMLIKTHITTQRESGYDIG